MSPLDEQVVANGKSFPRVSGDEPRSTSRAFAAAGFSPRERG